LPLPTKIKYSCQQQQEADPDYDAEVETERYYKRIQAPIGLTNAGNKFVLQHVLAQQAIWKK
jgi:hypothetical protein